MNEASPPAAPASDRVRLRRVHHRGHYDRASLDAVLDAGQVCHLGFATPEGPYVIPTLYWREGDHVYFHGSSASRTLRGLADGLQVCLTVSLIDGLVLARSGFHCSVNYRAAMLFGHAELVSDPAEVTARMKTFVDGLVPGQWDRLRPVTDQELKATKLLRLKIDEASAKIRTGGPLDDEEDYALPIWAGVVPMETRYGAPIPDPRNLAETPMPDAIAALQGQPVNPMPEGWEPPVDTHGAVKADPDA